MKEKAKYKLGDKVICIKYEVHEVFNFTNEGAYLENIVEKEYFGRTAIISDIQREKIETEYGIMKQDVDEYRINFIDEEGGSIAWIDGSDLIPMCLTPLSTRLSFGDVTPELNKNDHCHVAEWNLKTQ